MVFGNGEKKLVQQNVYYSVKTKSVHTLGVDMEKRGVS